MIENYKLRKNKKTKTKRDQMYTMYEDLRCRKLYEDIPQVIIQQTDSRNTKENNIQQKKIKILQYNIITTLW